MSFKNAIKIMITRFGLVWTILLYVLLFAAVIASLSVVFIAPIIKSVINAGLDEKFIALSNSILGGAGFSASLTIFKDICYDFINLFKTDTATMVNSTLFIVVVLGFASRFLIGLYEIPLAGVLDAQLSSNAKLSFLGQFVSRLGVSFRFVLCKLIYALLYDSVCALIFIGLFNLMSGAIMVILIPFVIMLSFILLYSVRFGIVCMWSPYVIANDGKVIRSFAMSVRGFFKNFGSVFSSFVVAWILIVALNLIVGLFTFGVGLFITVPLSVYFISVLGITIFYNKSNKRYYVDGSVITPPSKI